MSLGKQFVAFQRITVPLSSGSRHFIGLFDPKCEGSFEMSETVFPVMRCNIPEALIFQHIFVPFPMTIAIKPYLRYELFPIVHFYSSTGPRSYAPDALQLIVQPRTPPPPMV
jgi:hypothetical protein